MLTTAAPNRPHAVVIGSNVSTSGSIRFGGGGAQASASASASSAADVLDRVQRATVWSQRANMQDIPTDCAQRDERLGWMGDAGLAVEQCMYNFGGPQSVGGAGLCTITGHS